VLVTGGCGFIGSHVVDALLEQGATVRVLDDLSTGKRENLPATHDRLQLFVGSVASPEDLDAVLPGADAVVHLAALSSVKASVERPVASHQVNCVGTLNVLEACRRQGVRRLTFSSTAAVYGDPVRVPIAEDHRCHPMSPYAIDKLSSEGYIAFFRRVHGVEACVLRFFNVYGPRQDPASPYSGVISLFSAALREERPVTIFGDGRQVRDFVYVGDVVQAVLASLTDHRFLSQTINVGTGHGSTLLDVVSSLEGIMERRAQVRHGEPRVGDIRESVADVTLLSQLQLDRRCTTLAEGLALMFSDGKRE
jgi:UDP-glucose 4-epimerase